MPGKEREVLAGVYRRVDLLPKLRNRIAHHRPIIGSNWEKIGAKLAGWLLPDHQHNSMNVHTLYPSHRSLSAMVLDV